MKEESGERRNKSKLYLGEGKEQRGNAKEERNEMTREYIKTLKEIINTFVFTLNPPFRILEGNPSNIQGNSLISKKNRKAVLTTTERFPRLNNFSANWERRNWKLDKDIGLLTVSIFPPDFFPRQTKLSELSQL